MDQCIGEREKKKKKKIQAYSKAMLRNIRIAIRLTLLDFRLNPLTDV